MHLCQNYLHALCQFSLCSFQFDERLHFSVLKCSHNKKNYRGIVFPAMTSIRQEIVSGSSNPAKASASSSFYAGNARSQARND